MVKYTFNKNLNFNKIKEIKKVFFTNYRKALQFAQQNSVIFLYFDCTPRNKLLKNTLYNNEYLILLRYDMSGMYSPSSTPTAMTSYMNGSYMSMYGAAGGGGGSPYGLQGGPMSPGGSQSGGDGINHPSHSPGSVKSEAGGSVGNGPPTSVSMGSGSPGGSGNGPLSGSNSGPSLQNVKREPSSSIPPPLGSGPGSHVPPPSSLNGGGGLQSLPPGSGGPPPSHAGQHELSSLISMYLPGDAAAAAAGDTGAQSRIQSLSQQMYGHYGLMGGHHGHPSEAMGLAPTSPYPV
jgi:hypothetical protein